MRDWRRKKVEREDARKEEGRDGAKERKEGGQEVKDWWRILERLLTCLLRRGMSCTSSEHHGGQSFRNLTVR